MATFAGVVAARGPFFFMSCDPDELFARSAGQTSYIHASDGSLLATIARDEQRQPVPLRAVSEWARKATVAIEDRRFYEHEGVDYRAVARALVADIEAGETVEGGSTITQQVVRNLYLSSEQSLGRKLTEGCLAVALERKWSKDDILQAYLNHVYYGRRAYGIEAAARTYFSKPAGKLTIEEAALLAGLPQAPSELDRVAGGREMLDRRAQVLEAMRDAGYLSDGRFERARRSSLRLRPSAAFTAGREPIAEVVLESLVRTYGAAAARRGGFRVHTTVDPRFQRLAREAISRTLDRPGDPAAALVALNPRTGAIRAMVSVVPGREAYSFNLAVRGRRQVGSAFKPFVLVEAIDRGINPWATSYLSAPFRGPPTNGRPWTVETYDRTYLGRITLADATVRSDNTVYSRLTLDLGPRRVAERAQELGLQSRVRAVPSVGLGTASLSVLELASAYATLASGGVHARPFLIRKVVLAGGVVDRDSGWGEVDAERAISDAVAFHATRVLERNLVAGTGTRARLGRPAAGKTGTTENHADAWFAGYTPDLATAVWMGHPRGLIPMRDVHGIVVAGGTFPAEIWRRFMAPALEPLPARGWEKPRDKIKWKRFCGRFQFARSFADARPRVGCPKKRPRITPPQTTQQAPPPPTVTLPPPPTATVPPPPTAPPATQPPPTTTPAEPQPPQELVGRLGFVTQEIDNAARTGEIDVDGEFWPARSEFGDVIPAGSEIEVVRVGARFVFVALVVIEEGP